jgi:hypothetical protein
MHLLYLDDAGSLHNPTEDYLVLGGVSVYEAQADFITRELDKLAQSIDAANPYSIEFHASEIFSRRIAPWNKMSRAEAQGVIKAVLRVLADCYETARAFACAIHKPTITAPDLLEVAFEDLCSRFDLFLQRLRSTGDRQRGLIILDESSHETSLQQMARNFRVLGTKWGGIHNLADTPLFVDSKASRVVQLADHVAYAVFRRYNASDTQYFDVISGKFDSQDGVIHGLRHLQKQNANCMCPACMSRRLAGIH